MGAPNNRMQSGNTEVWSYGSGGDQNISLNSYNGSVYGTSPNYSPDCHAFASASVIGRVDGENVVRVLSRR